MSEKEFKPPLGWVEGKLVSTKETVDYFYDDEMCEFIDNSVKPNIIRSSMLNELNCDRKMKTREVIWDKTTKRAISRKIERKGEH
jgi:hypothetical protein